MNKEEIMKLVKEIERLKKYFNKDGTIKIEKEITTRNTIRGD